MALSGAIYFLLLLSILWLSVTQADQIFFFSTITRWGLWFINIFFSGWLAFRFLINPIIRLLRLYSMDDLSPIALDIGQHFPQFSDTLVNVYQLITRPPVENESASLRQAAIHSNLNEIDPVDFNSKLSPRDFLPSLKMVSAVCAAVLILLGFQFNEISRSTLRLLNPANEYLPKPDYQFVVAPGNTKIIRGQSVRFEVKYFGPRLRGCQLLLQNTQGGNDTRTIALDRTGETYFAQVNDLRQSARYQIKGQPLIDARLENRLLSDEYVITVQIPPQIKSLDINITPPLYCGLEKLQLDRNIGDIATLAGSSVQLNIESSKLLQQAELIFKTRESLSMKITGQKGSASFPIKNDDSYKIVLTDTAGLDSPDPIEYRISILPDNPPFIDIPEPGSDVESQLDARLPVKIAATDDFGFRRIRLQYQFVRGAEMAADTNWQAVDLDLKDENSKRQELYYTWDFNLLPLAFNDALKYYALAEDNNSITGPGIGKSRAYYVRFPSLDELFESISENQDEAIDKLDDVAKDSEKLKKQLEEINRELKRAEKLNWEQKQQVDRALEQQQALQNQVQEIQQKLQEMIEKLESNNLISEQLLEKYRQLQELFREVATPELMEAMQKLQQSMDKARPDDVRQALEKFKMQQDIFEKNIERTMELLKQVRLEQKMDELVQRAKNLAEQQKKISEQLQQDKQLSEKDFSQLQARQDQQSDQLERLNEDVQRLQQEDLMGKYSQAQQPLDSAQAQMNSGQMQEDMQTTQQNLAMKHQQKAGKSSQKLTQRFNQLQSTLAQAQQNMLQQGKQQVQEKMARAMQRLLQLSTEQEGLKNRTQNTSPLSDSFNEINKEQGQLLENFQKVVSDLVQVSKETFFINPKMSQSLQKAQKNMQQSLGYLSERENSAALQYQENAMSALNENVMQLRQSMSQMAQSQSGTGFEQFMQQLQQMAGAQGQINEETMGLLEGQGNEGQLSLQQQGQMRRLAGEQEALRQALDEMNKQAGNRQDLLGRMGELSQKMEEVVHDLLKQNVDRQTIDRQRQILSRMLDAQKSLHEREQSKQRKAEQTKQYTTKDPRRLGKTVDEEKKSWQDALQRAREQGYSQDYLKLIEEYFKALLDKNKE